MADLLTKKNWKFSVNKFLKTNSSTSYDQRRKDVADFFAVFVKELIEMSKDDSGNARISVLQSCDGVTNTFDTPGATNKNLWVDSSATAANIAAGNIATTNFKNTVYNVVSSRYPQYNSASASGYQRFPCAWIILKFDAGLGSKNSGELCISLGSFLPPYSDSSSWPYGATLINSSSNSDYYSRFFTISWSKTGFSFPHPTTWNAALPSPWTGSTWVGYQYYYRRESLKPIAADEEFLVFNSLTDADGGVVFAGNHLNSMQPHSTNTSSTTGMIGQYASAPSYGQKLHFGLAQDLSAFYAVAFRDNKHTFFMWFGDMEDGVKSSSRDWTTSRFCFVNGGQPFIKQFGYSYYDQYSSTGAYCFNGIQVRSSFDKDGVKVVIPSVCGSNGPNGSYNQGLGQSGDTYCAAPLSALMGYGAKDAEVDQYPIYPVQIFSQKYPGIKGSLTDIWLGTYGGNCCVYPATYSMTGASGIKFIQVNDIVIPWDGINIPQFSE